jgi:hypothetical protein
MAMPVDRSLLPPLPGKPDWYIEGGAPVAVEGELLTALETATPVVPVAPVARAEHEVLPEPMPELTEVITIMAEPHGRRRGRVRALAGLLRH